MAVDEAILLALAEGNGLPTIRFFQWSPPCLSLGYNQHWHDVSEDACRALGYGWTRRATGGKAILHTDEATYSLIVPQDDSRIRGGIVESYRVLSFGLLNGLNRLGVRAAQATRDDVLAYRRAATGGPVCFDTPSKYEITWQGKKLIGSAQLRRKRLVLQHGTLPLHGDLNRIIDVLALSGEEREEQRRLLPQRATTLQQAAGNVLPFDQVCQALARGFEEELNLTLEEGRLSNREQDLAEQLRAEHYANEGWLKRV